MVFAASPAAKAIVGSGVTLAFWKLLPVPNSEYRKCAVGFSVVPVAFRLTRQNAKLLPVGAICGSSFEGWSFAVSAPVAFVRRFHTSGLTKNQGFVGGSNPRSCDPVW